VKDHNTLTGKRKSAYQTPYEEMNVSAPDLSRPIKKLCSAVIARAIRDLLSVQCAEHGACIKEIKRNARHWIYAPRNTEFSFIWCCKVIGFCPNAMRNAIKRIEDSPELLEENADEMSRGIVRQRKAKTEPFRFIVEEYKEMAA
jgi:predicted metal-binding transcription factor (methanogenesis marker protein 9)